MNKSVPLDKQKFIFSRLFMMANKLQVIGDNVLGEGITIRQWLLTVAVAQYGEYNTTLSEAAKIMGSSHQNIKQLAVNLQKNGFIKLVKDKQDQRVTHIVLNEKSCDFWLKHQEKVRGFIAELFRDFEVEEINSLYESLNKLYTGLYRRTINT